jgi:hypothetical protein
MYPGIPNPPVAPGLPPSVTTPDIPGAILDGEIYEQWTRQNEPATPVPDAGVSVFGQNVNLNPLRSGAIWALIILVLIGGFFLTAFPAINNAKGEIVKTAI